MNEQNPPALEPQKGLSITSLVLGILSLGCFFITGIPAIITGHIALNRANKEPHRYAGKGMAIAGLVLGYLGIALSVALIPASLLLPALAKAKDKAQRINCMNNMKQIALGARIWSNDNGEKFPPDFLTMSNELSTPRILVCPGDNAKTRAQDWSQFDANANVSYEFLTPNVKEGDVINQPVFRCPIHENVAMGDGSVQQGSGRPRRSRSP